MKINLLKTLKIQKGFWGTKLSRTQRVSKPKLNMKILTLHSDYIKFKPLKKAIKSIAELSNEDIAEKIIKEPLVILTAIEKGDTLDSVKELIDNLKEIISIIHNS